ncbi:MAG TPA: STAS domain-containing protein [Solirubrobacteraceae bacterium]|jgi:anti-sigma B factor antagonist
MLSVPIELVAAETAVVTLSGEVDLWSAPELKRTLYDLVAAGRKRLVLDLSGVRFMDSTALGVLIGLEHRSADDEQLALAAPSAEVLRLLELTGVAGAFRIFPAREAAVEYVTADQAAARAAPAPPPLTADAALLLGITATAMPFAQSPEEQAERWLRALRRHGEAGAVLASVGVQEGPVSRPGDAGPAESSGPFDTEAVEIVTEHAGRIAAARGAAKLATSDVLRAVIDVYGETFERVIGAHGVKLGELVERLGSSEPAESEAPR